MSNAFRDLYEDDEPTAADTYASDPELFEAIAELEYDASTDTLTAGQSTPPSAAGFAPFSEWQKDQAFTVNKLAEDPQYEDAPASERGPFD